MCDGEDTTGKARIKLLGFFGIHCYGEYRHFHTSIIANEAWSRSARVNKLQEKSLDIESPISLAWVEGRFA